MSISLSSINSDNQTANNFESNFENNKYFKCNAILNLNSFDNELRDMLMYL